MAKDYKNNQKLKMFFEVNIANMGIKECFRPLLEDIMLRRATEFDLSDQEVCQDMISLMNNLTEIKIDTMPEKYKNAAGLYYSDRRQIIISEDYVKNATTPEDFERLYEILTHEVFHALARDQFGNTKISAPNKYNREVYMSLEEAIVEKAADRCVFGRNFYDRDHNYAPFFYQNRYGYHDITYITDIIEATYGVSEKAFLKHAIQGRQKVAEFLSSVVGENVEDTIDYLERIELNYSILHKALYQENLSTEEQARIVKDTMTAGLLVSSWKMSENISRLNPNSSNFKSRLSDFKYGHDKFLLVTKHITERFENRFPGQNISNYVLGKIDYTRADNSYRINTMSEILKRRGEIPENDFYKLLDDVRIGIKDPYGEDLFAKYAIPQESPQFIPLEPEEVDAFKRADFESVDWENSGISEIAPALREEYETNRRMNLEIPDLKIGIIKEMLKKYFEKNNEKLLNPGENVQDTNQNANFGRLSKEDMEKVEKGTQEVLREYKEKQNKQNLEIKEELEIEE